MTSGLVTTVAGSPAQASGYADGLGTAATLDGPNNVAMDAAATFVIVVSGRGRVLVRRTLVMSRR